MAAGCGGGSAAWQHPPGPLPAEPCGCCTLLWWRGGAAHQPPPAPLLELPGSPQRAPADRRLHSWASPPCAPVAGYAARWLHSFPLGRHHACSLVSHAGWADQPSGRHPATRNPAGARATQALSQGSASSQQAGEDGAAPWSVRARGQQWASWYGCILSRPWASRAMAKGGSGARPPRTVGGGRAAQGSATGGL